MHDDVIKLYLVDDHKIFVEGVANLLSNVEGIQVMGWGNSVAEAIAYLKLNEADVVITDIEMPGMTGLELIKKMGNKKPLIIFTTAKADYAVEAFELNVVDYLVKPIALPRFKQAIEKANEALESNKEEVKVEEQGFVFVKDNGILKRISIDDILFLEAMGYYVKVHTAQKFHVVHATLKSIEEKLPSSKFIRVHRSYIVAINKIDYIQEGTISIGKTSIPVADTHKANLNKRLNLL